MFKQQESLIRVPGSALCMNQQSMLIERDLPGMEVQEAQTSGA